MKQGKCRDEKLIQAMGVDFFYDGTGFSANVNAKKCRSICEQCPVIEECGRYAIENNEQHGIWGGMTAHERVNIRQGRGRNERAS